MKNKQIIIILSIVCLVFFTACGKEKKVDTDKGQGIRAMFTISDGSDTFRAMLAEAAQEAARLAGVELSIVDAENSIENQMNQIKNAGDVDIIICGLCDSSTAQEIEVLAGDKPIIFINSCPEEDYLLKDKYIYVGSNEEVAGELQADYILKHYSNKDTLDVAIIKGEKGHSATKGRTRAVKAKLEASGKKINYVFEDYADWSTNKAKSMFHLFLKTGQKADCVISNNDSMALGVIQAAKEENLLFDSLPVLGVDATSDGLTAVEAGEMAGTVFQPAVGQGTAVIRAAICMVRNGSIASLEGAEKNGMYVWVPFEAVTKENINNYQ